MFIYGYFAFDLFTETTSDRFTDENRPYEFGFNIEGEQHRHEKKDENGIIMGEFGFITADGIYHVTVYATDENGNFKILSMKNVRISAPLDGSPLYDKSSLQKFSPQVNNIPSLSVSTSPPPVTSTARPYTSSTTVRTYQGCSNCKIPVTTTTATSLVTRPSFFNDVKPSSISKEPGKIAGVNNIFPSQPVIQDRPLIDVRGGGIPVTIRPQSAVTTVIGNNSPQFPQRVQFPVPQSQTTLSPIGIADITPTSIFNSPSTQGGFPFNTRSSTAFPQLPIGQTASTPFQPLPTPANPVSNPFIPGSAVKKGKGIQNFEAPVKSLSPIGVVKEGLPPGVSESDVMALLYRFNYTVGFHGHHETGYRNGDKVGDYFVNGRDGISRSVKYVANEFGYQPNITFINLGVDSPAIPKEETEKEYGLKGYEFKWFYSR